MRGFFGRGQISSKVNWLLINPIGFEVRKRSRCRGNKEEHVCPRLFVSIDPDHGDFVCWKIVTVPTIGERKSAKFWEQNKLGKLGYSRFRPPNIYCQ
jgi:hypothetical protein